MEDRATVPACNVSAFGENINTIKETETFGGQ
jgi:hypothetical protein